METSRSGKSESVKIITSKKFAFLKRFEDTLTDSERKELDDYVKHQQKLLEQALKKKKEITRSGVETKKREPIEKIPARLMKKWFINAWEHQNKKKIQIHSEDQKEFLNAMCRYFSNDDTLQDERFDFLKGEFDLKKGLLIAGNYGCGKTSMMNAFHAIGRILYEKYQDTFMWFNPINCNEINAEFLSNENDKGNLLKKYSKGNRYFDDFGTEKHYYGDYIMREILENRHLDLKWKTYITSNLSLSEIEEKYGGRVGSRIRQMFNVLQMPGDDYRI